MRVITKAKRRLIRITLLLVVLAGLSVAFLPRESFGVVYRYVDKNGTESFTNNLDAIPKEYRKKAVVIRDGKKGEGKESAAQPPEGKEENKGEGAAPQEGRLQKIIRTAREVAATRMFQVGAGVIVFLLLFIFAGKIGSLLGFKGIGSIFRILLVLLLLAYLYSVYSKAAVETVTTIKEEVRGIQKKWDEKNEQPQRIPDEPANENKK